MKRSVVLLALVAVACREDVLAPGEIVPVNRVVIGATPAELVLDDTLQLSIVALSVAGDTLRGRQVTWSSSDPSLVAVSPGGAATASAPGTATITATIEGKSGTKTLNGVALSFVSVSAGNYYTCGLTANGEAWCWGANDRGQLGVGPNQPLLNRVPRQVTGGFRFQTVAPGTSASCGLLVSGAAECWGANSTGQLGDGTAIDRPVPTPVQGGSSFSTISAPSTHTCAVLVSNGQRCWGENTQGQLGDGTRISRLVPTMVLGGHVMTQVHTSEWGFSCGLDSGQAAWCWGDDFYSYLGHDTTYFSTVPVPVAGGLSFTQIDARSGRSCALSGGAAYCWGSGRVGVSVVPTPEPASPVLASISQGGAHTCGLTAAGEAWCWGANDYGQLGNGTVGAEDVDYPPTQVAGGLTFASLSAGDLYTCGIDAAGAAWCWGANQPALGVGVIAGQPVTTPTPVTGGLTFVAISAAAAHTCGLEVGGVAYCWGYNGVGQLGDGSGVYYQPSPTAVAGGLIFQSIVARDYQTCGISNGAAYCWGANYTGQLGDGTTDNHSTPSPVIGGLTFARLAMSRSRTCGLDPSGVGYCWGNNRHGALGDGTETDVLVPVPVAGGQTFSAIVAAEQHVCATTAQGSAFCWGDNLYGELGNGVHTDSPIPVSAAAGLAFVSIESSEDRSCGLTAAGEVYCWPTGFGQPGPFLVPGGIQFSQISLGGYHACGLTSAGAAYCWGTNMKGQLGNGQVWDYNPQQTTPAPVIGGLTFSHISAGFLHTCGLTTTGVTYCWGENSEGQLGVAGFEDAGGIPYPVKVRGQQ